MMGGEAGEPEIITLFSPSRMPGEGLVHLPTTNVSFKKHVDVSVMQ